MHSVSGANPRRFKNSSAWSPRSSVFFTSSARRVESTWCEFVLEMNAATDELRRAVWDTSSLVKKGIPYVQLIAGLANKGIKVPTFTDRELEVLGAMKWAT